MARMEGTSKNSCGNVGAGCDPSHVVYKVPHGDGPYVKAKHAQLIDKDREAAIVWFWKAMNAGDKVDSALKDMAVVMKQLNRSEEAIEAVTCFRSLCSPQAQESLENILFDLYKKCGRIDAQIDLLERKFTRLIRQGDAFKGNQTKTARSHGRKIQVSVQKKISRILKSNYVAAEIVYTKAQMIDPDANKACNLGLCLIKQARFQEAHLLLQQVLLGWLAGSGDSSSKKRAEQLLQVESRQLPDLALHNKNGDADDFLLMLLQSMNELPPFRTRRLPIFEEISSLRDQLAC